MKNLNERTYNAVLTECNDFFAAQGISIIGEGYKEIATNAALFESYVDQLTEGANADSAAAMAQLMVNTNAGILRESSMTGIQPVASLSMPVIRKLWPKFALKDAIRTEVAKSPRFVVAYTAPYMIKGDDEKLYLPYDLRHEVLGEDRKGLSKEFTELKSVDLSNGKAEIISWADDAHVRIANTPSAAKLQPLDELVIDAKIIDGSEVLGKVLIGKRLGVYGNAVYDLPATVTLGEGETAEVKAIGGQLIVQFDGKAQRATFALVGSKVDAFAYSLRVSAKAAVSSEYNEESWSVGFDIKRQDIDIPTGQHINAPLPIEALNDMMALYQIDGTKETVDLMTNIFAQKLDVEILNFLKESHANQPGNEAFAAHPEIHKDFSEYTLVFDCKPAAGFAGSPKAWREEIKPLIDHLAQKIKNATYLQAGVFTIVANPIDVQILANVDWQFRGGQGGNMDGVDVDYSVGTYLGANAYKVVASTNVPAGRMYVLFTPSGDTQMTYKYYPYTFSTEMGYVDPNRSRVPSLMMTKRHTFQEFMPAIGCIAILNNDGKGYFVNHGKWNVAE
jgi:hypothetical protein